MSKAFTKEDVDPPERSGRVRSTAGLPPGATNYITARGAALLREKLEAARARNEVEKIAELHRILESVTIVEPAEGTGKSIAFGAKVTVRDRAGLLQSYRIVGVEEIDFYEDAVSWISPIGKTLLAAELGNRITLEEQPVNIAEVEYPTD